VIDKVGDTSARFDIWYDFACVAGVANQAVEAIKFLREAVTRGYTDADGLMADSDLGSLHASPEFQRPRRRTETCASQSEKKWVAPERWDYRRRYELRIPAPRCYSRIYAH
jgi:hypothetical protein